MPETVVFVGAVVRHEDRILLVRQSAGHPLEGQWTVPWGRIEAGESPSAAAIRETWEEGGVRVEVQGLLGVQELPSPQEGGVALVYLCKHVSGTPEPRDTETDAAVYIALSDLDAMTEPMEPWSNWLVRRVFAGEFTVTTADPTNPLQQHGAFL
jgi:ADP-ribose pyrophosphatase YjhB (NUDIX family)